MTLPHPIYVAKSFVLAPQPGVDAAFKVFFPGWPADMPPDPKPIPKNVTMDVVFPTPNPGAAPALGLLVSVLPHLGATTTRYPHAYEMAALFDSWWDLRNAAIEEIDKAKPKGRNSPLFASHIQHFYASVDAFQKVESIAHARVRTTRIINPLTGLTSVVLRCTGHGPSPKVPDFKALAKARARVPVAPTPANCQANVQKAVRKAEGNLGGLGNGYAWAVAMVMEELGPVLDAHMPGFDSTKLRFKG